MALYMKQKVFSWGDKFFVYDESGREKYHVKGEVFSLGKKLHLYDDCERELAFIQQKLLTFLPKYLVSREGSQIAEVVKEFTFFKPVYSVKGLGWRVEGDFFSHEYEISADGRTIVRVTKEWFTFGDSYCIDIDPGVDEATALAIVLVIDACLDAEDNHHHND